MQPQIRYTKTSDGVNIAYYAIGSGPPTVWLPTSQLTHLEIEWRIDGMRSGFERIARNSTLVRYDGRGFGLSDRDVTDFSLDSTVRDLEGVVEALQLPPAVIMSLGPISMTALMYASLHPDAVTALVLIEGVATAGMDDGRTLVSLARTNFPLYKQLLAGQMRFAAEPSIEAERRLLDESMTQENCVAFFDAQSGWDVTDRLSRVAAPTLVLHRRGVETLMPAEACRRLAAALPNGTFTIVEGSTITDRGTGEAIASFLRSNLPPRAADDERKANRTERAERREAQARTVQTGGNAVILFTDVVSSTALTERMGDAAFREASRALDQQIRAAMRDSGGTPVAGKVLGDGVMGTFASAHEAIAAALRCGALSAASELGLHIGLHAGDVIREADNVYGGAVNIAARICDASAPGEVLVSDVVRGMARSSAGVEFESRGEREMKGVGEPVRMYAVRSRE